MTTETQHAARAGVREHILTTAGELFARRGGIQAVSIEEIIERSCVARDTLYRYFPSKTDLVLAFLANRASLWTLGLIHDEAWRRGDTPEHQLLTIFDLLDNWFHERAAFDACPFIHVLLELGPEHPAGRAAISHLAQIRELVRELGVQAGLRDPEEFAHALHVLMKGSVVAAAEGDVDAASRSKGMAQRLIDDHRAKPPQTYRPTYAGAQHGHGHRGTPSAHSRVSRPFDGHGDGS